MLTANQVVERATEVEKDGIFRIFAIVQEFYSTGIDEHLLVFLLLCLIVFDILLGVSRAWAQHCFSSSKLRKGVVSHVSVFLVVFCAYPFVLHVGAVAFINSFIFAMVASYGASILKNLSVLGVKFPALDNFVSRNIDHDKDYFQLTPQQAENFKRTYGDLLEKTTKGGDNDGSKSQG